MALIKIKHRRRDNTLIVRAKVPVNAASRALVDSEIGGLRRCVIPIIRDEGGRPYLEASAVAINYRGRPCLVTALHVLTSNRDRPLFVFGADGFARQLAGAFETDDVHDLAATRPDEELCQALNHIPLLEEARIAPIVPSGMRFYASVVGYPHSLSRLKDRVTLDTPMNVFSGRAETRDGGGIAVAFDKDQGAWAEDGHVLAPDPIGKSGGAIFGMRPLGLNAVDPRFSASLFGIGTDWIGKEIIGAGPAPLRALLERLTA